MRMSHVMRYPVEAGPNGEPAVQVGEGWLGVWPVGRLGDQIRWAWEIVDGERRWSNSDVWITLGPDCLAVDAHRGALQIVVDAANYWAETGRLPHTAAGPRFDQDMAVWVDDHYEELVVLAWELGADYDGSEPW